MGKPRFSRLLFLGDNMHPFWRIQVHANGGGDFAGNISELTFKSSGQPLPTVGGVPFSSSEFSSTFGAGHAFDGDPATFWSSTAAQGFPYHLGINFGTTVSVTSVSITAATGNRADRAPTTFDLEYSDNGVDWTPLKTGILASGWIDGQTIEFEIEAPKVSVSGNVTTGAGLPADKVFIFRWSTGKSLASSDPDELGDWQADVEIGEYGVTYIADSCQPVTHGPYTATEV